MIDEKSHKYDVRDYEVKFDAPYVIAHTHVPFRIEDVPRVIGWSGPARSGTTAFLYLLASQPGVDRAYFQPQKTILRTGGPVFNISDKDKIICLKEVFGGDLSMDAIRTQDPIELLLDAGVPPHKITWVTMLREPTQVYGSLQQLQPDLKPEIVSEAQKWALELFHKHRANGIKMIPYVYELAKNNEEGALRALFSRLELPFEESSLLFDLDAIEKKLVPGQLSDPNYFEKNIKPSFDRGKYAYKDRRYDLELPPGDVERIKSLCDAAYYDFFELAKKELGL